VAAGQWRIETVLGRIGGFTERLSWAVALRTACSRAACLAVSSISTDRRLPAGLELAATGRTRQWRLKGLGVNVVVMTTPPYLVLRQPVRLHTVCRIECRPKLEAGSVSPMSGGLTKRYALLPLSSFSVYQKEIIRRFLFV
jgi:hypothetical protein